MLLFRCFQLQMQVGSDSCCSCGHLLKREMQCYMLSSMRFDKSMLCELPPPSAPHGFDISSSKSLMLEGPVL